MFTSINHVVKKYSCANIITPDVLEDRLNNDLSNKTYQGDMIITKIQINNKDSIQAECVSNVSTCISYSCDLNIQGFKITRNYLFVAKVVKIEVINDVTIVVWPLMVTADKKVYQPFLYPEVSDEHIEQRSITMGMRNLTNTNRNKRMRIAMTIESLGKNSKDASLIQSLKSTDNIIVKVEKVSTDPNSYSSLVTTGPADRREAIKFVADSNMPVLKPNLDILTPALKEFYPPTKYEAVDLLIEGSTYYLGIQGYFQTEDEIPHIPAPLTGDSLHNLIRTVYTNWQEVALYASSHGLADQYEKYLSVQKA